MERGPGCFSYGKVRGRSWELELRFGSARAQSRAAAEQSEEQCLLCHCLNHPDLTGLILLFRLFTLGGSAG